MFVLIKQWDSHHFQNWCLQTITFLTISGLAFCNMNFWLATNWLRSVFHYANAALLLLALLLLCVYVRACPITSFRKASLNSYFIQVDCLTRIKHQCRHSVAYVVSHSDNFPILLSLYKLFVKACCTCIIIQLFCIPTHLKCSTTYLVRFFFFPFDPSFPPSLSFSLFISFSSSFGTLWQYAFQEGVHFSPSWQFTWRALVLDFPQDSLCDWTHEERSSSWHVLNQLSATQCFLLIASAGILLPSL